MSERTSKRKSKSDPVQEAPDGPEVHDHDLVLEETKEPEASQPNPADERLKRLQQSIQERQRRGQERARQQWQLGNQRRRFPS